MCVAKMCGISKTNQNSNENKWFPRHLKIGKTEPSLDCLAWDQSIFINNLCCCYFLAFLFFLIFCNQILKEKKHQNYCISFWFLTWFETWIPSTYSSPKWKNVISLSFIFGVSFIFFKNKLSILKNYVPMPNEPIHLRRLPNGRFVCSCTYIRRAHTFHAAQQMMYDESIYFQGKIKRKSESTHHSKWDFIIFSNHFRFDVMFSVSSRWPST